MRRAPMHQVMVPPAVRSTTASTEMEPAPVCAECGGYVGTDVTRYMVDVIEKESEVHVGISRDRHDWYKIWGFKDYENEAKRMNGLDLEIISNALQKHARSGSRYYIDVIVSVEMPLPPVIVSALLRSFARSKDIFMVKLQGVSREGEPTVREFSSGSLLLRKRSTSAVSSCTSTSRGSTHRRRAIPCGVRFGSWANSRIYAF